MSLYRIHKSLSYKNPEIRLLNAGLNIIVKFTEVYMNLAFNVIVFHFKSCILICNILRLLTPIMNLSTLYMRIGLSVYLYKFHFHKC